MRVSRSAYNKFYFFKATLLLAVFALLVQPLSAFVAPNVSAISASGVVINEFSSGTTTDWVELYNSSSSSVDLTGWELKDSSTNHTPLSGTVTSHGFVSFNFGNSLNVGGDTIKVVDGATNDVDTVIYGTGGVVATPSATQFAARTTDGDTAWELRNSSSRDASNVTPVVCSYDFASTKSWEITWGHSLADRNGPYVFNTQSHGGLETIDGQPLDPRISAYDATHPGAPYHWLYAKDTGDYTARHIDYGFADGTVRTADITWSEVSGCHVPAIVWGLQLPLPTAVTNQDTGETFDGLEQAINDAQTLAGHTLLINENLTLTNDVDVTKDVTIDGQGNTIFANFAKNGDNGNNSALSILARGVTIQDLIVDGAAGTQLHGVNVYEATDVLVSDVTAKNFRSGVVAGQGSTVTVHNITTSGNTWHGMNSDKPDAVLTVTGISTHLEATGIPHIYVDDKTVGRVVDVVGQYAKKTVPNPQYTGVMADVYTHDVVPPTTPRVTSPTARQWLRGSSTTNSWTLSTDANGIAGYEVKYEFVGRSTAVRFETGTSRTQTFSGSYQGPITISVRAKDTAGHWSVFSSPVTYNYDSVAPTTDIVAPTGTVGSSFTVSGDAGDNLALNRVYVQLVNRQDNKRYGGTTINLIGQGTNVSWMRAYDAATLDLPDGDYAAHVSVVDMAGNTSSAGWTANFTVDSTIVPIEDDTRVQGVSTTRTDSNSLLQPTVQLASIPNVGAALRSVGFVQENQADRQVTDETEKSVLAVVTELPKLSNNSGFGNVQGSNDVATSAGSPLLWGIIPAMLLAGLSWWIIAAKRRRAQAEAQPSIFPQ